MTSGAPPVPPRVQALTFDCYGTLIDWDGGARAALERLPGLGGLDLEQVLRRREREERALESGAYQPYSSVLRESLRRAASALGRELGARELDEFAASIVRWPPFPDSRAALARLRHRYRLLALSNIEEATLRASAALLGDPFEGAITAGAVRSYKPAPAHFERALERLALEPCDVLHVAQSLYHDVRPALALGFPVAWVDRQGEGLPPDVQPTLVVRDLAELASILLGD